MIYYVYKMGIFEGIENLRIVIGWFNLKEYGGGDAR